MSGSLNRATLIGSLGKDPEIRSFGNGNRVCNLSVATSESWKDKSSGEKKEKTEWHRVSIFNEPLIAIAEKYLKKGSKVYLEGTIETRKYEKDGIDHYSTEICLRPYNGLLKLLSPAKDRGGSRMDEGETHKGFDNQGDVAAGKSDMDDEIPF